MKQLIVTSGLVLLTLNVVMAQQPGARAGGHASGTVAQALMDMEHQWAKATHAGDGNALAPMLAEDFVALDADGSMHGKSDVVARTTKAKWATSEIGDMKVMVHGDSAVVTGSWTGSGTDAGGKAVNVMERWADTWVKMANGKWQCVASATAAIK